MKIAFATVYGIALVAIGVGLVYVGVDNMVVLLYSLVAGCIFLTTRE